MGICNDKCRENSVSARDAAYEIAYASINARVSDGEFLRDAWPECHGMESRQAYSYISSMFRGRVLTVRMDGLSSNITQPTVIVQVDGGSIARVGGEYVISGGRVVGVPRVVGGGCTEGGGGIDVITTLHTPQW